MKNKFQNHSQTWVNIVAINRIQLSRIAELSELTEKFLREEADDFSSHCFLTCNIRADGTHMDGSYFCTGDLEELIIEIRDSEEPFDIAVLMELEELLKALRDAEIDEVEL